MTQTTEETCDLEMDLSAITKLRIMRNNPVIFIAASMLETEVLPTLYKVLSHMGHSPELDVVLYGRGGEVASARRFGILLHKFCDKLNFIVPFHCQSCMTILALTGNNIIAGDMALFSPIDPSLNCDGHGALASEEIRLFSEMGKMWFGIDSQNSKTELLSAIAGSVFPTTLTALYRATQEVEDVAYDLLSLGSPQMSESKRKEVINHLIRGYHSHNFAPTNDDFHTLGLPIIREHESEMLSWELVQNIQSVHGGGARKALNEPNNDFIIASEQECWVRQVLPDAMGPVWKKQVIKSL